MSKFIKDGVLQPGNYTISTKGYTHICAADEGSGFDGSSEVYAKNSDTNEILFNAEKDRFFTLKNNETGEEEIISAICDSNSGLLFFKRDESENKTDETDIDEEERDEDDEEERDEEADLYWRYGIHSDQLIVMNNSDGLYVETDQFYYEEYAPEGIVEKSFEIKEPLNLSNTSFQLYEDDENERSFFLIVFPEIGRINNIKEKGEGAKHGFAIDDDWGNYSLAEIRNYLGGPDITDPGVSYTEIYDGFIIKDGVLKAYKGFSNRIVIPKIVTEIADNVFLFPVESIKMPDKSIKVGKNFPWDKVL